MTVDDPLVSVCIPSYNNENYITETVESVFDQSYRRIELIVSDDGSQDRSADILKQLKKRSPFPMTLNVVEQNQGLAANWNAVLSSANGAFVKILPGDDVLSPKCIEKQVTALQSSPESVLAFCGRKVTTRSGRHLLTARFFGNESLSQSQILKKCILTGTNVIGEPGAVLFSARLSREIGEFDDTRPYVIDLQYWFRLLKHGGAVSQKDLMASFRIDQNLSVRIGSSRKQQFTALCEEYAQVWPVSTARLRYGRLRAEFNEVLRRIVHRLFQFIG